MFTIIHLFAQDAIFQVLLYITNNWRKYQSFACTPFDLKKSYFQIFQYTV